MGVSRQEVIDCYRYILDREPESEHVIEKHMARFDTWKQIKKYFMLSKEYKDKNHKSNDKLSLFGNLKGRAKTKFDFEELNNRITSFDTGEVYKIASRREVATYELKDLKKEDIHLDIYRFNIKDEQCLLECLIGKSATKKLYVFLSSSGEISSKKRQEHAKFERINCMEYMDGVCLYIEDPMAKRFPGIPWGGYFGDESNFYVENVVRLVMKISDIYDIPRNKIMFIGISSGAFAGCHACSRIEGSRCVMENPRFFPDKTVIDLEKWKEITGCDLREAIYESRLRPDIVVANSKNRFQIFMNRASKMDYEKGLLPFMKTMGIEDDGHNYYRKGNVEIYIMDAPYTFDGNPHSNWLNSFLLFIAEYLDRFDEKTKSYIINHYVKENRKNCLMAHIHNKLKNSLTY